MTFLTRRRQMAMKIEPVFGVDAVPTAADLIEPLIELEYTANFDQFEREFIKETLGSGATIPGERSATVSFTTELKGSGVAGTPPPHLSVPLLAVGFSEVIVPATSVTYSLVSTGIPSVTIEIREVDDTGAVIVKKLLGGCGTMTIDASKGQVVTLSFEFTGKYVQPFEAGGPLAPSPGPGITPLPFLDVGFSFQGFGGLLVQQFTADLQNECTLKNDFTDATGNQGAVLTDRNPVGTINPEQVLPSAKNPWDDLEDVTEGILTWTLGSVAGNIVTYNGDATQITSLADGDREGIATNDHDLKFNPPTGAGDGEVELVFT